VTPEYPGESAALPSPTRCRCLSPCSTSCSAAPAMKSATTASTAIPQPSMKISRLARRHKAGRCPRFTSASRSCKLRGHLPNVAIGSTASTTSAFEPRRLGRGDRQIGGAGVRRGSGRRESSRAAQFGIVADKRCRPLQTSSFLSMAVPATPSIRPATAPRRRDADHHPVAPFPCARPRSKSRHHGDVAAESEHLLHRLPSLFCDGIRRRNALGKYDCRSWRSLDRQRARSRLGR